MTPSNLRILFVCTYFPYPEVDHSGGTDLFNYIKWLSQRHEISLISFIHPIEEKYVPSMRELCANIEVISRSGSVLFKAIRHPLRRLTQPKRSCYSYSTEYEEKLKSLLGRERFDVIHFEGPWMGQYLDLVSEGRTVLDEVDVHSMVAYRQLQYVKHSFHKAYAWFEWAKCQTFELGACQRADLVLTRSEKDRRFLQGYLPGLRVEILPPWFEGLEQFAHISEEPAEEKSLLFLGSMNRTRNVEAALYFYEKVLPLIREEIPQVKFYIVGSSPTEKVQQLAKDKNVVVTGYVKDIGPYYERCAVFVAPILVGGGIIVKTLNAMSAGRPVVTTRFGNEGIEAIPEQEIRIADSPEEFAQKTVELLTCHSLWRRIATGGRKLVRRNYDWEKAMQRLERAYFALVEDHCLEESHLY